MCPKLSTVQDYKCTKNQCEWNYTHITLKLRVKQVIFESKHIMATQKGQSSKIISHGGILEISAKEFMHLAGILAEGLTSRRETAVRVAYLSIRIHPESCHIFPVKAATTLFSTRNCTVGAYWLHRVSVKTKC